MATLRIPFVLDGHRNYCNKMNSIESGSGWEVHYSASKGWTLLLNWVVSPLSSGSSSLGLTYLTITVAAISLQNSCSIMYPVRNSGSFANGLVSVIGVQLDLGGGYWKNADVGDDGVVGSDGVGDMGGLWMELNSNCVILVRRVSCL